MIITVIHGAMHKGITYLMTRASLTVKSRGKTEIKGKYMKIKRVLSFYKHCNSGLIAVKYYHKNTESNRKNCDL